MLKPSHLFLYLILLIFHCSCTEQSNYSAPPKPSAGVEDPQLPPTSTDDPQQNSDPEPEAQVDAPAQPPVDREMPLAPQVTDETLSQEINNQPPTAPVLVEAPKTEPPTPVVASTSVPSPKPQLPPPVIKSVPPAPAAINPAPSLPQTPTPTPTPTVVEETPAPRQRALPKINPDIKPVLKSTEQNSAPSSGVGRKFRQLVTFLSDKTKYLDTLLFGTEHNEALDELTINQTDILPNGQVKGARKINKMAILGETEAMGYLADTQKGLDPDNNSPIKTASLLAHHKPNQWESIYWEALDTYKSQFASPFHNPRPETQVNSHQDYLQLDREHTKHLASSTLSITEQANLLTPDTDYVVLQIPTSYLCAETIPFHQLQQQISQLLHKIGRNAEKPIILLIPPLPIHHIFMQHADSDLAFGSALGGKTCGHVRNQGVIPRAQAPICPAISKNPTQEQLEARIEAFEKTLVNAVKLNQDQYTIRYARELLHTSVPEDELAIDCLHLNQKGLSRVAETSLSYIADLIL